ncbi:MAG: cobalamin B12-binding domain-containing protein [Candidatus Ranarchaeia archaeon]
MEDNQICDKLAQAVIEGDKETARKYSQLIINQGKPVMRFLKEGLIKGMSTVTDLWREGEYFLPDVVMSANAMKAGTAILEQQLVGAARSDVKGTIVIGTIKGDIHDIGKNLVSAMLKGGEFNVIDLGVDQEPENFVAKAEENNADIIAVSCILTTSVKHIESLLQILNERGLRSKYKVIVGGAALSDELARQIGADGYASTGDEVVQIAATLLAK